MVSVTSSMKRYSWYCRYLYALQIKRDLDTGLLFCQEHTAVLLASYVVQGYHILLTVLTLLYLLVVICFLHLRAVVHYCSSSRVCSNALVLLSLGPIEETIANEIVTETHFA